MFDKSPCDASFPWEFLAPGQKLSSGNFDAKLVPYNDKHASGTVHPFNQWCVDKTIKLTKDDVFKLRTNEVGAATYENVLNPDPTLSLLEIDSSDFRNNPNDDDDDDEEEDDESSLQNSPLNKRFRSDAFSTSSNQAAGGGGLDLSDSEYVVRNDELSIQHIVAEDIAQRINAQRLNALPLNDIDMDTLTGDMALLSTGEMDAELSDDDA